MTVTGRVLHEESHLDVTPVTARSQPNPKTGAGGFSALPISAGIAVLVLAGLACSLMNSLPTTAATQSVTPSMAVATLANIPPTMTSAPTWITSPEIGVGSAWTRPADGMVMMYVPEGSFQMGSETGRVDESPIHPVSLNAYWMDRTEVTNSMYRLCVEAGICTPPVTLHLFEDARYQNHPVVYVDWYMAKTYCDWTGARLPTEAEWEMAARGTDGRTYPWGEGIDCTRGNYTSDCRSMTAEVGSYASGISPYGLFDMAGNVIEWVMDWYDPHYYSISPILNPQGPVNGQYRAMRDTWWNGNEEDARSTSRDASLPTHEFHYVGFRCALSP